MIAKTHMLSSLSLGLAIPIAATTLYNIHLPAPTLLLLFMSGVLFGATFPDIDEPRSYVGKQFPIFSNILSLFIKHRGITHTLIVLALYYGLFLLFLHLSHFDATMKKYITYTFAGFLVGNVGHILGDMSTINGVSLFYPLIKKSVGILPKPLRYRTGGAIEKFLVGPLFTLLLLLESLYLFKMYNGKLLFGL